MVGTGLPEEKQVMLTESPSCMVTVLFRFTVVGVPAVKYSLISFRQCCLQEFKDEAGQKFQHKIR